MAVTNEQVAAYLASNPGLSDAQIAQTMAEFNVTPAQMAAVTGIPESQIAARVAAVAPEMTAPAAPAPAPAQTASSPKTWDEAYSKYGDALRSGNISENTIKNLYGGLTDVLQPDDPFKNFSSNIIKIKNEIDAQKKAGTADYWGAGNLASPDSAAWDSAFRLAEKGVGSLYDLKQVDGQTVNTKTGQPLEGFGNAYNYDLDYNLQFSPEGIPVLTANNQASEWVDKYRPVAQVALQALAAAYGGGLLGSSLGLTGTAANVAGGALIGGGSAALTGGNVLKGAVLGGAGGYLQGAGGVGTSIETDASFLANDASRLAAQGLSESQIADILGASGYASTPAANLAASMAVNGLDVGTITNQLDALSANTGLYQQNLSQGEFGAYDALGLQDVVGNDFAAIEQNLVASGVDPLVAADISQQLAFNPNITQSELASNLTNSFGNNIYDVNVATTYPTSVLPGSGGLLSDVAGTTGTTTGATTGTTTGTGITPGKILDAVKLAGVVAGIGGSATDTGKTGFDIVPVPSDWTTPTYGQPTGSTQGLAPINFGSRDLLRGTQWEKYLQPQTMSNVINTISQQAAPSYAMPAYTPAPMEQLRTYANEPLTGIAAFKPTSMNDVMSIINNDNNVTPSEAQALQLLSNPNLSNLPSQAANAIASAVGSPRSYQDVISSGVATPSNLSGMSPEIQRAYEIYQQSMVLGAPRSIAEAAYSAAGVNPTNPDAFFANLGLTTGTPTQDALAKYAPLALDQFAKVGGGSLTYTIDPSTVPAGYTPPNVPTLANSGLNAYINSIQNSGLSDQKKIDLISARSQKYGVDPATYLGATYGQTPSGTVG